MSESERLTRPDEFSLRVEAPRLARAISPRSTALEPVAQALTLSGLKAAASRRGSGSARARIKSALGPSYHGLHSRRRSDSTAFSREFRHLREPESADAS